MQLENSLKTHFLYLIATTITFTSIVNAETDYNAHNKRYDYRKEVKMPTVASKIKKILGVPAKNWSTFGSSFSDCPELYKWSKEKQKYFKNQNSRKSKKYLTNNEGKSYTLKESEIETTFYSCLSEIRFLKSQVSENKKYKNIMLKNDIPRLLKKHPGFNAPKSSLNSMIYKNISDGVIPNKNDIYFIDMYKNTYVILQKTNNNTALFYDTKGKWPSIYFIASTERALKEKMPINNAADYYTFEGVYTYKNNQGFERQAYKIKGHIDPVFRTNSLSYFYTKQWLKDKNIKGM